MGLVDAPQQLLDSQLDAPIVEEKKTSPFVRFAVDLGFFWSKRNSEGRKDEPFNTDDWLAVRNIVEPAMKEYVERSSTIPWINERLNPYRPDNVPCHRLELDHSELKHNWRDEAADAAAIPFAPPISILLNPPQRLYEGNLNSFARGFDNAAQSFTLDEAVINDIYSRGVDQVEELASHDQDYRNALYGLLRTDPKNPQKVLTKVMVTWAIDSAIPGVDVHRVATHAGSIEAICEYSSDFIEIPSIARLSELSNELKLQLNLLYDGLVEMRQFAIENTFTDYDERSVALFMQTRSIVDACRWHVEQNKSLSKSQREILNKTLVEAYTTYHAILQTCGPVEIDDVRSFAHRDVSVLLSGGKVDTEFKDEQYGTPDVSGEEDYLGAFMAAASYDVVANEYTDMMMNADNRKDLNWHGGARSYFGTFEGNSDSTMRQQLLLMEIMYLRMPAWQRELYHDLISSEISKKIARVEIAANGLPRDKVMLYVPTQDNPVEVNSQYGNAFYWMQENEVYASQHLMPMMDLIANHHDLMQDPEPRLQIRTRPGIRGVVGMEGSVNKDWVFVPEAKESDVVEEIPPLFVDFIKALNEKELSKPRGHDPSNYYWESWYKERLDLVEDFVKSRTTESSTLVMPFLEKRLNPPPLDISPCALTELPNDFKRNQWESRADHALVPHLPQLDYFLNPPPNLWDGDSRGSRSALDGYDAGIIRDEIRKVYGRESGMEDLINDPERLMQIYLTWASDTRIEGVEAIHAEVNQQVLQQIFNHGDLSHRYPDISIDQTNELYLIMPKDLQLEVMSCEDELYSMMQQARDIMEQSVDGRHVPDDSRVLKLAEHVDNTILAIRWHLDHLSNSVGQDFSRELLMLSDTLMAAYEVKSTIMQEFCPSSVTQRVATTFHDLSTLIAGYKIDTGEDGVNNDKLMPTYGHDYFDAFMVVATAHDVATKHEEIFGQYGDRQRGARPILGSFEAQAKNVKQQLALLTTIYHRMPEWQRVNYRLVIDEKLDHLRYKVGAFDANTENFLNYDDSTIFIPSASTGSEKLNDKNSVFDLGRYRLFLGQNQEMNASQKVLYRRNLYRAQHVDRVDVCMYHANRPSIAKSTKGVEIFHDGAQVRGFGAGECWIDDLGFLHPGYEKKVDLPIPSHSDEQTLAIVEQMGNARENMWLSNLRETQSVTVESRLGPVIAERIETLLDQDINNGSVENLGSLGVILEKLLGRELIEGDSKYLAMLQSLGMLNREAIDISAMGEKDIRDMLAFVKTEKPKLEDMDESSLILLFLGAAGVAPRQELVEQIIKAHETTANILTLEAVEAIESISKKKKNKILEFLGIIPKEEEKKSFLTRRDELRNYLAQKKAENPRYRPEDDKEWREMQIAMVKYIVELVNSAKSYDSSADSTISSVLAARDKGRFLARCHTNGQILTTLLNLGIPEFKANFTGDYGPEGNLTIEEFLRHLLSAAESGASSHAYSSSNRNTLGDHQQIEVIIADGESGKVRLVAPDNVHWRYPSEMVYGTLANHHGGDGYEERKGVLQSCVTGGSTVSADIARDMGQLDLAEMADPDSDTVNLMLMRSKGIGIERRAKALRKIMEMYPHMLAMAPKNDYANHILMHRLSSAIEVGREAGNWGAAFFASNIMANAVFLGSDANEQGLEYRRLFARKLAVLKQGQYEAVLKNNAAHLTTSDLELIALAREEYLAELAEMMRKSNEPGRKIEKELKKKKKAESASAFKASRENTERISRSVKDEDLRRKREDEKVYGVAEGSSDKDEYNAAADQKIDAIKKEVLDPDNDVLKDNRFQPLSNATQDLVLLAAVTGPDENLLEGPALDARIAAIQHLFVKYAFDHKQLRLGSAGSMLMQLGGSESSLVRGFEETAIMLNNRLGMAVERTGLPVDVRNFSPRAIAEQMKGHDVQVLLGRDSTKQLHGKLQ